ncbi:MAG: DUF2157 domain-containing protein [Nitrospirae bacterium]|nr:DUF2157 domain-containing protein [Nitrospirota bacterium]MBF0534348.1 DUF2157 domain-containing protein [Nitrospirota bacterium]MBF0615671.1 DUF2157 domain-containing protein [Nitrospirota bacterium]
MVDQKVVDYIKTSLAQGKTKEELYKELLGQGCTIEIIQENFNAINAEQEKEDTSKRTIRIIVTIGAIFVGAGIFSFIAANWQEMSKPLKIGVILVSMLVSYGIGWYLKEKLNMEKTGSALFLLGSIIYGAGIFLVAQMFHTRANWPDGFILWMFGVIAVAFALESFSHFYLAILLGFVAMIGHPIEIFTGIFGYQAFLLTSSFLLLIVTIVTFITGWIIRKKMPPELKEFY